MTSKKTNIIAKKLNLNNKNFSKIFFILIALVIAIYINHSIFKIFIQALPFIIFIPLFFICIRPRKKKETLESQSIMQKRIKRFKSIKRGYYSLIILMHCVNSLNLLGHSKLLF